MKVAKIAHLEGRDRSQRARREDEWVERVVVRGRTCQDRRINERGESVRVKSREGVEKRAVVGKK